MVTLQLWLCCAGLRICNSSSNGTSLKILRRVSVKALGPIQKCSTSKLLNDKGSEGSFTDLLLGDPTDISAQVHLSSISSLLPLSPLHVSAMSFPRFSLLSDQLICATHRKKADIFQLSTSLSLSVLRYCATVTQWTPVESLVS